MKAPSVVVSVSDGVVQSLTSFPLCPCTFPVLSLEFVIVPLGKKVVCCEAHIGVLSTII